MAEINKLESSFSQNNYYGRPGKSFEIMSGNCPILVSVPHAVNHFRDGNEKKADLLTGAIGRYLHEHTGCHLISALHLEGQDPNYDGFDSNPYQQALSDYIAENEIKVVLDIHGSLREKPFAVELGTIDDNDSSLLGHPFIKKLMIYSFDYFFRDINDVNTDVTNNTMFNGQSVNTVTKSISSRNNIPCVQVEINRNFRDTEKPEHLAALICSLEYFIGCLSGVNWSVTDVDVFRLGQSVRQKPLEKVEFLRETDSLDTTELVSVCSDRARESGIHVRGITVQEMNERYRSNPGEYLLLTNRLIDSLFSEPAEAVIGRPVVVYRTPLDLYPIGVPKADQVDRITLSSTFFDRVSKYSKTHNLLIRSPFTNSNMYIDIEGSDYGDGGTVHINGSPAEKVMIPRYFRLIMGLTNRPLEKIDVNEYNKLLNTAGPEDCNLIRKYYKPIQTENYCIHDMSEAWDEADRNRISELLEKQGAYSTVEVVLVPKTQKGSGGAKHRRRIRERIASRLVGEAEFYLSTSWSNEIDDRNRVARVSTNMMNLLGVEHNDKVVVDYNGLTETIRVLPDPQLRDYQISVPSPIRKKLRMTDVNEVVKVKRSAIHAFSRHSQMQTLAILGVILAVFQVTNHIILGLLVSALITPFVMYLILNEERIKVK